jgi:hypothetical protein
MLAKISTLRNWTPRRLPRQFSLRAIFIVTTLVAICGGIGRHIYDVRLARQRLLDQFNKLIEEQNDAAAIAAVAHKIEVDYPGDPLTIQVQVVTRMVLREMNRPHKPDGSFDYENMWGSMPTVEVSVVHSAVSDDSDSLR